MSKKCLVIAKKDLENLAMWKKIKEKADPKTGAISVLQVFSDSSIKEFLEVVREKGVFKERYGPNGIEEDSSWQQIIFYALVAKESSFFVYERANTEKKDEKEQRLSRKISVGVGGHIEPFDSYLIHSLYRELAEELTFSKNGVPVVLKSGSGDVLVHKVHRFASIEIRGIIRHELDEVSGVHVGLFCIARVTDPTVEICPKSKEEMVWGRFVTRPEYEGIISDPKNIAEGWTQLVMRHLEEKAKAVA